MCLSVSGLGALLRTRGEWGVLHWENHSSYKLKSSTDLEITKTRLMHTKYTPWPGAQSWQLKTFTLAQRALITTLLAGFNLTIFKFFSSWCGFKPRCFDSREEGLTEYQSWQSSVNIKMVGGDLNWRMLVWLILVLGGPLVCTVDMIDNDLSQ